MAKNEQKEINNACLEILEVFQKGNKRTMCSKKLRSCQADVVMYTIENGLQTYIFTCLYSYNTMVAIIDRDGDCYDVLRKVYGYTPTSAKHISKFFHDYGYGKMYRYYPV